MTSPIKVQYFDFESSFPSIIPATRRPWVSIAIAINKPANYFVVDRQKVVFDRAPFHPLINPSNGSLCTLKRFESWDPNVNHIWQVIQLVKDMFMNLEEEIDQLSRITGLINYETDEQQNNEDVKQNKVPDTEDHPLSPQQNQYHKQQQLNHHLIEQISNQINLDAVKLFHEDFESFQFNVAEVVVESRSKLYDPPETDASDEHQIIFGPFNPDIHEDYRRNFLLKGRTIVENGQGSAQVANQAIFYVKSNQDVTIN